MAAPLCSGVWQAKSSPRPQCGADTEQCVGFVLHGSSLGTWVPSGQADPPYGALPQGLHRGSGAWLSAQSCFMPCRKNMQRNKQVAMGRKKFNMDPKKVLWDGEQSWLPTSGVVHGSTTSHSRLLGLGQSQQPGQGLAGAATDPQAPLLHPSRASSS